MGHARHCPVARVGRRAGVPCVGKGGGAHCGARAAPARALDRTVLLCPAALDCALRGANGPGVARAQGRGRAGAGPRTPRASGAYSRAAAAETYQKHAAMAGTGGIKAGSSKPSVYTSRLARPVRPTYTFLSGPYKTGVNREHPARATRRWRAAAPCPAPAAWMRRGGRRVATSPDRKITRRSSATSAHARRRGRRAAAAAAV
jgi:hypothetical protein